MVPVAERVGPAGPATFARIMSENPKCPECASTITYPTGTSQMCGACGHEWNPEELEAAAQVRDANGNVLQDGDDVVVIKDLPVKGMPKPVKAGTKVKNIRLVDGAGNAGHDIDCKIDGFGAMGLKSIYVRKA
ncbi:MAG: hypothetical protein GFGODING_01088 [Flavobacteriales bacterium]|nr:hypothetical protein [Flavobacteriales bacterium]